MKRKPFLIQALCLGMIMFGMHGCFYHVFLPFTSLTKFMAALFLASIWFTALSICPFQKLEQKVRKRLKLPLLKHPVAFFLLLLTFVCLAVYILRNMERIRQDAQILYDVFLYRYDVYYGNVQRSFSLSGYVSNGSRLLFSVEFLLTFLMAKAFSRQSGMFLGTLPIAVLLSGCLLLGKTPEIWDMVCIVCGMLGMQVFADGSRVGGRTGFSQRTIGNRQNQKVSVIAAVFLVVVFSASSVLSVRTADTCLQGEEQLIELQHKIERKVVNASVRAIQRLMMMLGIEQPGVMTNVAPSYTGKTVMTITAAEKPDHDIYLRGFIGTRYENGRWSNTALETTEGLSGYQMLTRDYAMIGDNMAINGISLADQTETIEIEYDKSNGTSFGYLPYFSQLSDNSTGDFLMDGDYGIRRNGSVDKYWVDLLAWDGGFSETLQGNLLRRGGPVPVYVSDESQGDGLVRAGGSAIGGTIIGGTRSALDASRISYIQASDLATAYYCNYILERDTWLPDEGLERTKELAQALLDDNYVALTTDTRASYSPEDVLGELGVKEYTVDTLGTNVWEWDLDTMGVKRKALSRVLAELSHETVTTEDGAEQVVQQLRYFLWSTTSYSKDLKMKPSRQDYVENFLFQQKKGYCEHYATTGAVLLRAMGIPARYVSGYKVAPEDFIENTDGTFTANVIDSQAHAWTEVYTYGDLEMGWEVADMTPPDSWAEPNRDANEWLAPTEDPDEYDDFLDSMQDSSDKVSPEDDDDKEDTAPTPGITDSLEDGSEEGGSEDSEDQEDAGSDGSLSSQEGSGGADGAGETYIIFYWIGLGIVCCGTLLFAWNAQALYRHRRLRRYKVYRRYILEMNCLLERYLRCCGYRGVSKLADREYLEFLKKIYPEGKSNGDLEDYYQLLERARFAEEAGSPKEVQWCRKLLVRLGKYVIQRCSAPRRFYVRWVRNWRR